MNRTKACRFLDCLRLILFASIVEVISLVGVTSQDYKHICIAYTSDDSFVCSTLHPFPSMVQLSSIEGIAWQDCLDLCIACTSDLVACIVLLIAASLIALDLIAYCIALE